MSEIVITQSDQGKTIDAQQGDVIVLSLEENIATGYGWEIESNKGTVLTLEQSNYNDDVGMEMGRGGTRALRFGASALGSQEICLQLRRPWDPPEKAIKQFSITIQVR